MANGIMFPPFHHGCRSRIVPVFRSISLPVSQAHAAPLPGPELVMPREKEKVYQQDRQVVNQFKSAVETFSTNATTASPYEKGKMIQDLRQSTQDILALAQKFQTLPGYTRLVNELKKTEELPAQVGQSAFLGKKNKLFGAVQELLAARWLIGKGYSVHELSRKIKGGEIDIIAFKGDTLFAVEVKGGTIDNNQLSLQLQRAARWLAGSVAIHGRVIRENQKKVLLISEKGLVDRAGENYLKLLTVLEQFQGIEIAVARRIDAVSDDIIEL
jgi:hypothetical protein